MTTTHRIVVLVLLLAVGLLPGTAARPASAGDALGLEDLQGETLPPAAMWSNVPSTICRASSSAWVRPSYNSSASLAGTGHLGASGRWGE